MRAGERPSGCRKSRSALTSRTSSTFPKDIHDYGPFNISLINDLPYPAFPSTPRLLPPGLIRAWYVFPEIRQNWLGFSLVGNHGSGLGLDFAAALHENLGAVLNSFGAEEITRSSHLEKVCLIKDGVGKDNISDFTTNLIKGFLLEYTQEFAARHLPPTQRRRFHVDRAEFNYATRSWQARHFDLPAYEGDFVLLTPKDILTKDETWINKSDMFGQFDDVLGAMPDAVLRAQLNDYFLQSLPEKPKPKDVKEAKAATIRKYPLYVDHFIRMKEDQGDATELSGKRVASVESTFVRQVKEFVYLVADQTPFYATGYATYEEARRRVLFLKDVIENKGGHRLFSTFAGRPFDASRTSRSCIGSAGLPPPRMLAEKPTMVAAPWTSKFRAALPTRC